MQVSMFIFIPRPSGIREHVSKADAPWMWCRVNKTNNIMYTTSVTFVGHQEPLRVNCEGVQVCLVWSCDPTRHSPTVLQVILKGGRRQMVGGEKIFFGIFFFVTKYPLDEKTLFFVDTLSTYPAF